MRRPALGIASAHVYLFLPVQSVDWLRELCRRLVSDDSGKSVAIAKQLSTRPPVIRSQPFAGEHPGFETQGFETKERRDASGPRRERAKLQVPNHQYRGLVIWSLFAGRETCAALAAALCG